MNFMTKNAVVPKLMIVGAGVLQLPAIQKAKYLGIDVAVIDIDPNAPGVCYADKFYEVSTNDISGILAAAENYHPDPTVPVHSAPARSHCRLHR